MTEEIIQLFKYYEGTFVRCKSDGVYNANAIIKTDGHIENIEGDNTEKGIPLCKINGSKWVLIILHNKATLFTNRKKLIQEVINYEIGENI